MAKDSEPRIGEAIVNHLLTNKGRLSLEKMLKAREQVKAVKDDHERRLALHKQKYRKMKPVPRIVRTDNPDLSKRRHDERMEAIYLQADEAHAEHDRMTLDEQDEDGHS